MLCVHVVKENFKVQSPRSYSSCKLIQFNKTGTVSHWKFCRTFVCLAWSLKIDSLKLLYSGYIYFNCLKIFKNYSEV